MSNHSKHIEKFSVSMKATVGDSNAAFAMVTPMSHTSTHDVTFIKIPRGMVAKIHRLQVSAQGTGTNAIISIGSIPNVGATPITSVDTLVWSVDPSASPHINQEFDEPIEIRSFTGKEGFSVNYERTGDSTLYASMLVSFEPK